MTSALLRSAKNSVTYSNEQRMAIVKNSANSLAQWTTGITASSSSVAPGSTVTLDVKYNSPDWEQEIAHYFNYSIQNSSATDSITFRQGPLYHFEQIVITINDSRDTITLNIPAIKELVADYLLNTGLKIYENRYFSWEEFDTFNGITIGPNSSRTFWYPLDMLLSFAQTCVQDEIKRIKFDLTVLSEQSNGVKGAKYCTSSSTANLWTQANIKMNNLSYIRHFALVRNPALYVKLIASLPQGMGLRHLNWKVVEKVVYSGSWLTGASWNGKMSDIGRYNKIQFQSFYVRPVATGFNDANACKEYSGPNYLGWKIRQLNTGGNEKILDLSDPRKQKNYALAQYQNSYGEQQLPLSVWNNSGDLLTQYMLHMTRIDYDYLVESNVHEVERLTSSANSNGLDFDITINALADVGANCELVCNTIISETYAYTMSGPNIGQVALIQ